jgi:hypothetical protein
MSDIPDPENVKTWLEAGKSALDLFRAGVGLLPKSEKRDELEAQIRKTEIALQETNARLAKELGYELCQCTFPPQIML